MAISAAAARLNRLVCMSRSSLCTEEIKWGTTTRTTARERRILVRQERFSISSCLSSREGSAGRNFGTGLRLLLPRLVLLLRLLLLLLGHRLVLGGHRHCGARRPRADDQPFRLEGAVEKIHHAAVEAHRLVAAVALKGEAHHRLALRPRDAIQRNADVVEHRRHAGAQLLRESGRGNGYQRCRRQAEPSCLHESLLDVYRGD